MNDSMVKWESSPSTDSPRPTTQGMSPSGEKVILTGAEVSLENGTSRSKLFQGVGKMARWVEVPRTKLGVPSW